MKRRVKYKSNHKKEKAIMLASSLFVLSALTMTGFYVKEKNQNDNDGYIVDFSKLENQADTKAEEIAKAEMENTHQTPVQDITAIDDMDYDPVYREANSIDVANEKTNGEKPEDMKQQEIVPVEEGKGKEHKEDIGEENKKEEMKKDSKSGNGQMVETASAAVLGQKFSFNEGDTLQWPIAGNVLLNYSMDKTVYFATLQQYKYNPAIVIGAAEGATIAAAADGKVAAVYEDAEIGQAVDIDLGSGYQLTYGQLKEIPLMAGDVVKAGDIVGYVNAPSKYYSAEGSNVYFKLTKDGVPVNPLSKLE